MFLHVTAAEYRKDYRVWLQFNNGIAGEVELESALTGAMFAPLKDLTAFQTVRFDPQAHTIAWANGADLAPEFLLDLLNQQATAETTTTTNP